MKVFLKTLVAFAFAFSCLFAFAACGQEEAVEGEAPVAEEPAMATIGTEVEGEHVFAVELTNSTGYDIVGFSVKLCEEAEFTTNMLAEGDVYTAGETRMLYFDAAYGYDYMASQQSGSDMVLDPAFDIQLTLKAAEEGAEDTVVVLHQFPFGDMEKGEILLAEAIAYVSYTSAGTGESVSTLEAEKQILDTAQTAAADSGKTADSSKSQNNSSGTGGGNENNNTEAPAQPETPSESSDSGNSGCIGDEGLVY